MSKVDHIEKPMIAEKSKKVDDELVSIFGTGNLLVQNEAAVQAAREAMRRIKEAATGESLTPINDPLPSVQKAVYVGTGAIKNESKPKEEKVVQKPPLRGKLRPLASAESTQSSDSLTTRAPKVDRGSMGNSAGLMNSAPKPAQEKPKAQSEADNSSMKSSQKSTAGVEQPKNQAQFKDSLKLIK